MELLAVHLARFSRFGPDRPTQEGGASFSHEASNWVKTSGVSPDVTKLPSSARLARLLHQPALTLESGGRPRKASKPVL